MGKENGDLRSELESVKQTVSLEKEKFMDQQAKLKEVELKYSQLKRDLDRSTGKVVDMREQRKRDEYEWEREKKRIQEARLETVSEKSAVEGRNEVGWKILEDRRLSWVPLFVTSALSNLRVEFLTQSIQLVMRLALLAAVSRARKLKAQIGLSRRGEEEGVRREGIS